LKALPVAGLIQLLGSWGLVKQQYDTAVDLSRWIWTSPAFLGKGEIQKDPTSGL